MSLDPQFAQALSAVDDCLVAMAALKAPLPLPHPGTPQYRAIEAGADRNALDRSPLEDDLLEDETRFERRNAVRTFIDSLAPRQQYIVRSLFWTGRTQAEIAAELGISQPAVSKHWMNIRSRGRSQLSFLYLHDEG